MPINTLELKRAMLAQIGAEGTQRYTDARDVIPAMNGAIRRFEAMAAPILAERKGSEESLSELQETRIFQTNFWGGLSLDGMVNLPAYQIWTVIGLFAEPTMSSATPSIIGTNNNSYFRGELIYLPGGANERPVKRMTMEEVSKARNDFTAPGNEVLAGGERRSYAYYMMGNRSDTDLVLSGGREIVITPTSLTRRVLIGMSYLRSTPEVTVIDASTNIPYPISLFSLIRDLALNELSIKQGNGTTLYSITEREISRLLVMQN